MGYVPENGDKLRRRSVGGRKLHDFPVVVADGAIAHRTAFAHSKRIFDLRIIDATTFAAFCRSASLAEMKGATIDPQLLGMQTEYEGVRVLGGKLAPALASPAEPPLHDASDDGA